MERLTYDFCVMNAHCWQIKGADNLECREVCENQDDLEGCKTCPIAKAFNRLAEIENILGDEYDLDRMRELVEADRNGRCAVLPVKPGGIVRFSKNPRAKHERVDCISIYSDGKITLGFHEVGMKETWVDNWSEDEAEKYVAVEATPEDLRDHECSGLVEE